MRRQIPKRFLVGLGCGMLLTAIGMALVWQPAPPHPPSTGTGHPPGLSVAPEAHSTPQDIKSIHAEIARLKENASTAQQRAATLQRELAALRAQLAQVDRGQTTLAQAMHQLHTHGPATRPELPGLPDQDTVTAARTPEEEAAFAEAQIQMQIQTLETTVREEKLDPSWASTAEQTLHTMESPGFSLMRAECRTSLCRLELTLDGTTPPEESFHTLLQRVPWPGQSFLQMTDGEVPQVVLYLAREGYALLQGR